LSVNRGQKANKLSNLSRPARRTSWTGCQKQRMCWKQSKAWSRTNKQRRKQNSKTKVGVTIAALC